MPSCDPQREHVVFLRFCEFLVFFCVKQLFIELVWIQSSYQMFQFVHSFLSLTDYFLREGIMELIAEI